MKVKFWKYHGLGNDFILIHDDKGKAPKDASFVKKACSRNLGIGADGVVYVKRSKTAVLKMRIFNSDGSEAEMCGNGIRCLAKYAYDYGLAKKKEIAVETLAGLKRLSIETEGGRATKIRVEMGAPMLAKHDIPMQGKPTEWCVGEELNVDGKSFKITAVSMGNPHAIIFKDEIDEQEVLEYGPKIESNAIFPKGINVEFVRIISPNEIEVKVWERGAGLTLACGTGACASVVAGIVAKKLKANENVRVHLPGGDLVVLSEKDLSQVYMTGPAEEVFRGELEWK